MVEFLYVGSKQRVTAVHLRFMWAACEETRFATAPTLSQAIGSTGSRMARIEWFVASGLISPVSYGERLGDDYASGLGGCLLWGLA